MIAYATYAHKSYFGKWSNAIHACESYMKTLSLPLGSESGMSREHSASQAPEIATVFALDDIEESLAKTFGILIRFLRMKGASDPHRLQYQAPAETDNGDYLRPQPARCCRSSAARQWNLRTLPF